MSSTQLRVVEDSMNTEDRNKALDAALSQIEKAYGKGSIMRLGDNNAVEIAAISTGSLGLDIALGIGGLPRGRVVEIYGPESSGKTTLALHVIAEAQKTGGTCAFVDAEHALDTVYARKLGVDVDELLISQPDTGEQALEIADTLVRSGASAFPRWAERSSKAFPKLSNRFPTVFPRPRWRSVEIRGEPWRSVEICGDPWRSVEIREDPATTMMDPSVPLNRRVDHVGGVREWLSIRVVPNRYSLQSRITYQEWPS